jgi:hypothetical protein
VPSTSGSRPYSLAIRLATSPSVTLWKLRDFGARAIRWVRSSPASTSSCWPSLPGSTEIAVISPEVTSTGSPSPRNAISTRVPSLNWSRSNSSKCGSSKWIEK